MRRLSEREIRRRRMAAQIAVDEWWNSGNASTYELMEIHGITPRDWSIALQEKIHRLRYDQKTIDLLNPIYTESRTVKTPYTITRIPLVRLKVSMSDLKECDDYGDLTVGDIG